jgi:hypothetical protein
MYIVGHAPLTVAAGGGYAKITSDAIDFIIIFACRVILWAIIEADV